MARKKKRPKRSPAQQRPAATPTSDEPKASIATTVAWMLTALCTAAAELLALGAYLLSVQWPPAETPAPLALTSSLMLWTAMVTGLLTLALTPVVYRVRQSPPPLAISAGAMIVGIIPPVILAISYAY